MFADPWDEPLPEPIHCPDCGQPVVMWHGILEDVTESVYVGYYYPAGEEHECR